MATIREVPLVKNEIYHVFNRSVGGLPIFETQFDSRRALELIQFYRNKDLELRFSHYNHLAVEAKQTFLEKIDKSEKLVDIYAFTLMPNHFHFLLKALDDHGIQSFTSNFQNSFAKYFNTKNERHGALFQQMFKAVRIEDDKQLLHVCRYIHLNPLTSFILKEPYELKESWNSSFRDYVHKRGESFVNTEFILKLFPSVLAFEQFTLNRVDYQRRLSGIRHLLFE